MSASAAGADAGEAGAGGGAGAAAPALPVPPEDAAPGWVSPLLQKDMSLILHVVVSEANAHMDEKAAAPGLENRFVAPGADLVQVDFKAPGVFDRSAGKAFPELRSATDAELDAVGLVGPAFALTQGKLVKRYDAPNGGRCFTIREVIACMADFERSARLQESWCGGIDVHHIFYEGLHRRDASRVDAAARADADADNIPIFSIGWGS